MKSPTPMLSPAVEAKLQEKMTDGAKPNRWHAKRLPHDFFVERMDRVQPTQEQESMLADDLYKGREIIASCSMLMDAEAVFDRRCEKQPEGWFVIRQSAMIVKERKPSEEVVNLHKQRRLEREIAEQSEAASIREKTTRKRGEGGELLTQRAAEVANEAPTDELTQPPPQTSKEE